MGWGEGVGEGVGKEVGDGERVGEGERVGMRWVRTGLGREQRERFVVESVTIKGHGNEWLGKMKADL